MIRPRFYRLACISLLFFNVRASLAQSPEPAADEHPKVAAKTFEKDGGHFEEHFDPATGKPVGIADQSCRRAIRGLSVLWLSGTGVRDTGLQEIASLTSLTTLGLDNTNVTDRGLKELVGLKNLSKLYLDGTRVTDAGIEELKNALPKCKVIRN